MREDTAMVRVKKALRNKLKVKAAREEKSIAELLEELLEDVEWK